MSLSCTYRDTLSEGLNKRLYCARSNLNMDPRAAAGAASEVLDRAESEDLLPLAIEAALIAAEGWRRVNATATAGGVLDRALSLLARGAEAGYGGQVHKLRAMVLLSEDRVALALAAAHKALASDGLSPRERPYVYGTIAMCYGQLCHIELGHRVMVEQALPAAEASADPEAIVACNSRMAGLMHVYACVAAGIDHISVLGMKLPVAAGDPAPYLRIAHRHLDRCAGLLDNISPSERGFHLAMKGLVVGLDQGIHLAVPYFETGLRAAGQAFPRSRMNVLQNYATALRIGGLHGQALERLLEARGFADKNQDDQAVRAIAYELSLVYRALGDVERAMQAMETHVRLHARKSLLSTSWSADDSTRRHYGDEPNLGDVRDALLGAAQPEALQRADQYIQANYNRRIVVAEIARHSRVSVRKLQQLYQQHRGVPVSEVVRERRMQVARQLLQWDRLPVAIVAERIGYSSPANFSRDFKQRYGISASSARQASVPRIDAFAVDPQRAVEHA